MLKAIAAFFGVMSARIFIAHAGDRYRSRICGGRTLERLE